LSGPQLEEIAKSFCKSEKFEYIEFVGRGAFKESFKARHSDGSLIAVKVFRGGVTNARSDREIDALRRCSHPQIARLGFVKSLNVGGATYLVTCEEYLSGGTLTRRLDGPGVLSVDETRSMAIALVDALSHIAALGLVHRDIKPDNIMFREDGRTPVIVDFGLVRDLSAESLTQTWLLRGPGTPFFAPPEQLLNEKALIDWRADQFSLGVVLSIASTKMHPYQEAGDDDSATVERVARRTGPTDGFRMSVRSLKMEVLEKMVGPWPIQRFRTPRQLVAAWASMGA
jgi:Serine/threonine protein kinase